MKAKFTFIFLILLASSINCLDKEKDCKCRILPESKIVGGKQAHHLSYPWITSISHKSDERLWPHKFMISDETKMNFHSCGGSIINEYWILTAAHCIPENRNPTLYVGFGNDNDLVKIFDSRRIKSLRLISHPNFVYNTNEDINNDIALIELSNPIQFTNNVKPACFLNKNKELYFGLLEHPGWGSTEAIIIDSETDRVIKRPNVSQHLKEIYLTDESDTNSNCENNNNFICAKGVVNGESSCKGDSGGPIHYTKNGKSYVVGLTSYTNDIFFEDGLYHFCIGSTTYTRVSNYIEWIKKYVKDEICDF